MSILVSLVATQEKASNAEPNHSDNANSSISEPKIISDILTISDFETEVNELGKQNSYVYKDANGNVRKNVIILYKYGAFYFLHETNYAFSNNPSDELYRASVNVVVYSNGDIISSHHLSYTEEKKITDSVNKYYSYYQNYTEVHIERDIKNNHTTEIVTEVDSGGGSKYVKVAYHNKDGHLTKVVEEYRANGILAKEIETKYTVSDSNTGEDYKSATITTLYLKSGAVNIQTDYLDKYGKKKNTINKTTHRNGWKAVNVTRYNYHYKNNKHTINMFEACKLNDVLYKTVETKSNVSDSNTGEIYKSFILTTRYTPKGKVYSTCREDFDGQGNKIESNEINTSNEIKTKYKILDSNSGKTYKSSVATTYYGPLGEEHIDSDYFDEQENKIKNVHETDHKNDSKDVKITNYNYNQQITKEVEEHYVNDLLLKKVETKYTVSGGDAGKTDKSVVITTHYGPEGESDIKKIKNECFDKQGNIIKTNLKVYIDNVLDKENIIEYAILDSNANRRYKSVTTSITYSVNGGSTVVSECFNMQGNIIKDSEMLYANHILNSASENYFNDSGVRERNVTINTNYDTDGNVSGYSEIEYKSNKSKDIIGSQNKEYDIYGQEIINIKDRTINTFANVGPDINSLIGAMGSFLAQESPLSSIDFYVESNMLNTFVAADNPSSIQQ